MKRPTRTFLSFGILAIIYIVTILVLPPNTATAVNYHLTATGYKVLALFVAIPNLAIWLAAFYGYSSLDSYSAAIRRTTDGKAFMTIAYGLRWLAWGLPINSIIINILGGIAHAKPGFLNFAVILTHYIALLISIVAFTIIYNGTSQLIVATGKHAAMHKAKWLLIGYIVLATAYCSGTIDNVATIKSNPYHLSVWLISFTIIAPYLYAWLMGLLASYQIGFYRQQIKGIFYKRALSLISGGLGLAIVSSIGFQYMSSSSSYLRRIEFNWRLLLAYFMLMLYAVGFIMVALGANKLRKIEEV